MRTERQTPLNPHSAVRELHDKLDRMDEGIGLLAGFLDQVPDLLSGLEQHLTGNLTREAIIRLVSEAYAMRRDLNDLRAWVDANASTIAEVQA